MKKRLLIEVLVCTVCTVTAYTARAQQSITGNVYNAQTNQPIAGANITFGVGQGTTTDAEGIFTVPCEGSLDIVVSHIGYRTFRKTISDCNYGIEIPLVPLSYSLQKINVTDRADIQEASSVAYIGEADLKKKTGLRLENALNTVPGVEMQSRSPWGGQRITIRGYYPNAGNSTNFNGLGYQLFLNNIPVTDAGGTTIMDDIDFSTLGQVEVMKGPSPLFGNEIAGTVQLYTQQPQENGTTLSQQVIGGSYGLFRNNTTLMTKSSRLDLRINYGRQFYGSFRPHDSSEKDYLSIRSNLQVSDNQMISAYLSYNNSEEQLAGEIDSDAFYAHRAIANDNYVANNSGVDIESFRSGVTSLHNFSGNLSNKTTVFVTGHTLDQRFAHGFNYHNNLNFGARTDFTYRQQFDQLGLDAHLGAFIQKTNESVNGVFIPPFISPPFSPSTQPQFPTDDQNYALNYNLFTKWNFSLPADFRVSVGGILNFNKFGIRDMLNNGSLYSGSTTQSKRFDPTFSPSLSVLKSFNNMASVYGSISTGQTPPLLGDIIASDGSVNNQLNSERAVQYEIGSKGNLINNRLSYKLALFDLEISDRLVTQYENSVAYTTNAGKQQNQGLELSLGYKLLEEREAPVSLVNLWLSYTYSDFTYTDFKVYAQNTAGNDSTIADYSGNDVAGVAPNKLELGIDLQTGFGLYFNSKYRYMDEVPITFDNQNSLKAYSLLGARIGFKKELGSHFELDAFAGSNNLTGSTNYNFVFVGQNIGSLGDGYILPAPYEATFYGGITLKYSI